VWIVRFDTNVRDQLLKKSIYVGTLVYTRTCACTSRANSKQRRRQWRKYQGDGKNQKREVLQKKAVTPDR
jgi:hypothetical protein